MGKLIDLSGERFGFWLVIKQDGKNKNGQTKWLCKCECGTEKSITSNSLRTANSVSCGCLKKSDLIGETFGSLTVKEPDYSKGRRYWLCDCECGKQTITSAYKLREKLITSCGCKKKNTNAEKKIKMLLEHSEKLQKRLEDFSKHAKETHENFIKLTSEFITE